MSNSFCPAVTFHPPPPTPFNTVNGTIAFLEDEVLHEGNLKKGVLTQCALDTVLMASKWRFNAFNLIGNRLEILCVTPEALSVGRLTPGLTDVSFMNV